MDYEINMFLPTYLGTASNHSSVYYDAHQLDLKIDACLDKNRDKVIYSDPITPKK